MGLSASFDIFQRKGEELEKKKKPLYSEEVQSSSADGGLNFLKRVIIGFKENELEDD